MTETESFSRARSIPAVHRAITARAANTARAYSAFADATKSLSEVGTPTDERDLEGMLIDMKVMISGCQDFTLVNEIDFESF